MAPRYYPPDAWMESLDWLREETEGPFGEADLYYSRYETPFDYSAYPGAYGVTAWWDYGYWIVRIGHRPPSENPGGAIPSVAEFFVARDESEGQRILDEIGARYVILDSDFVLWKIDAAMSVTGKSAQLHDSFVQEYQGEYYLRTYFFPEYYRSMSVRLNCFGGKAVTPAAGDCQVISWTLQGQYKLFTGTPQPFDTYEAALAWIDSQGSQKMGQVGGGGAPEWLSTHPSNETRLRDLQGYVNKVMPLYEKAMG